MCASIVGVNTETQTTDKYDDPRRPAREARKDYHLRNVLLPMELTDRLGAWEGWISGGPPPMYILGSNARAGELVSPSMLDAAADELEIPGKFPLPAEDQTDCDDLIATMRDLADYPDEDTAKSHGLETTDSGLATWLMG